MRAQRPRKRKKEEKEHPEGRTVTYQSLHKKIHLEDTTLASNI